MDFKKVFTVVLILISTVIVAQDFENKNKSIGDSRWLSYGDQVNALIVNGESKEFYIQLFPDTNIIVFDNQGNAQTPNQHMIASIIEPHNMPEQWIGDNVKSALDSVAIYYYYYRNVPQHDTLRVYIIGHNSLANYQVDNNSKYSYYQDIYYDTINNKPADTILYYTNNNKPLDSPFPSMFALDSAHLTLVDTVVQVLDTITYILTDKDTTDQNGYYYLTFDVNDVEIGVQERVGAIFEFVPGYDYNNTDTLSKKNNFIVLSNEENGEDTYAQYRGNYNMSYTINTQNKYYNDHFKSWRGYFFPTIFWTKYEESAFPYEHHEIYFKLVEGEVSIEEHAKSNSCVLYQNEPNPVVDNTIIKYSLKKSQEVNFKVIDIAGNIVYESNLGYKPTGTYSLPFNASNLSSGIYFYTLFGDDFSVYRKMVKF